MQHSFGPLAQISKSLSPCPLHGLYLGAMALSWRVGDEVSNSLRVRWSRMQISHFFWMNYQLSVQISSLLSFSIKVIVGVFPLICDFYLGEQPRIPQHSVCGIRCLCSHSGSLLSTRDRLILFTWSEMASWLVTYTMSILCSPCSQGVVLSSISHPPVLHECSPQMWWWGCSGGFLSAILKYIIDKDFERCYWRCAQGGFVSTF